MLNLTKLKCFIYKFECPEQYTEKPEHYIGRYRGAGARCAMVVGGISISRSCRN